VIFNFAYAIPWIITQVIAWALECMGSRTISRKTPAKSLFFALRRLAHRSPPGSLDASVSRRIDLRHEACLS
jgi:hypothetical protein